MLISDLTPAQLAYFDSLERAGAALSLCGTAFVLFTFLSSSEFQKPINRLIFYACLGNVFMSIASIIARQALLTGTNTWFCKFQAFLIQMFLPADALWTFVMALNVFLTFFHKFDAGDLRSLEKWYFLGCYGIPFILSFAFLFVKNYQHGDIYGDATLWCWISSGWDIFRIAAFYGPVWVIIVLTIAIYVYAGREIYNKTKMLRDFQRTGPEISGAPQVLVTTSTTVTSSAPAACDKVVEHKRDPMGCPAGAGDSHYNVTVTGGVNQCNPRGRENTTSSSSRDEKSFESQGLPALRGYATPKTPTTPTSNRRPSLMPTSMVATSAMLSYTKVAVLFFIAMMMTWVPSSANRVYSVIHPKHVAYPLEAFSAFVLPLQGFWNAVIYAVTSLEACKSLWREIKTTRRIGMSGLRNMLRGFPTDGELPRTPSHMLTNNPGRSHFFNRNNDSETRLKESRPQTGKREGAEGQDANTSRVVSLEDVPYQIDESAADYSRQNAYAV